MPTHSAAERHALAGALSDAGPGRPTLCDGWTTTELAIHLLIRERRPDVRLAEQVGALSGWLARVRSGYLAQPYPELVEAIRTGPPRFSPAALPWVDERLNLIEHFVHCEDVRRALPGWSARELPSARQQVLFGQLGFIARLLMRPSPVAVTLRTPAGASRVVRRGEGGVVIVGEPSELTLYCFGRKDHALVQLEGPEAAVSAFRRLTLRA